MGITVTFLPAEEAKPHGFHSYNNLDALVLEGASELHALTLANIFPVWDLHESKYVFDLGVTHLPLAERERYIKEVLFGGFGQHPIWDEPVLYQSLKRVDDKAIDELIASLARP